MHIHQAQEVPCGCFLRLAILLCLSKPVWVQHSLSHSAFAGRAILRKSVPQAHSLTVVSLLHIL